MFLGIFGLFLLFLFVFDPFPEIRDFIPSLLDFGPDACFKGLLLVLMLGDILFLLAPFFKI